MATQLTRQTIQQLRAHYAAAKSRLFLLDYDGTLVGFAPTPAEAVPTPELYAVLGALVKNPANTVAIVSGRDKATLQQWFGHLPIGLAAEHGHFIKPAGESWRAAAKTDDTWKHRVLPLLQAATQAVPGSMVEQKQMALCWHYRQAKGAEAAAQTLANQLAGQGYNVLRGAKVLEVRAVHTTKAAVLRNWPPVQPFVFIAGDDTTDEALFAAAPPHAFTIKVRPGKTAASYYVPAHHDLLTVLTTIML